MISTDAVRLIQLANAAAEKWDGQAGVRRRRSRKGVSRMWAAVAQAAVWAKLTSHPEEAKGE
jgi:hypothetical protein